MNDKVYNLTTLTEYLNQEYKKKKTGEPFKRNDVQFYIKRGYLPLYLGNIKIVHLTELPGKIYKLVKK